MQSRAPTSLAAIALLALAAFLPAATADPVDDALADTFEVPGMQDYRQTVITLCNKCDVTPGTDVPQQDTPSQEVPDHEGSEPQETPDHNGSAPLEVLDYPGTPAGPTVALGGVTVSERDGELCTSITIEGVVADQTLFCYNPSSLDEGVLAEIPRGTTPFVVSVPATDPYDTPDDQGGTDPQDVQDVPGTDPQATPDVESVPVGPVHVPKYELTVYYRAYYDCGQISRAVNLLGEVQSYKPFDSDPSGLAWYKANGAQTNLRFYVYLYQDGTEVTHTSYANLPFLGQLYGTYLESVTQGVTCS